MNSGVPAPDGCLPKIRLDRDHRTSTRLDSEPRKGAVPGSYVQNAITLTHMMKGSEKRAGQKSNQDMRSRSDRARRERLVQDDQRAKVADSHRAARL